MPRSYPNTHLCFNTSVGFSVKKFEGPTYIACFLSRDGRRLKKDTNQARQGQAIDVARTLIEKEYAPVHSCKVTWDEAVGRLDKALLTSGNRKSTVKYYRKIIRLIRKTKTAGPADLTPDKAAEWKLTIMTTPSRRKKPPSAHYVTSLIIGLSSLWQKWFIKELKIVKHNPWEDVEPPKADRLEVKFATDEQIEHFFKWADLRFGGWGFPKLFLSVKAYTGCRLMDLCSLQSVQLAPLRLIFPADLTKGRKERKVPLPADLFAALDAFKGKTWLWENYLPPLKEIIKARNWPIHQLIDDFSPDRLYNWIETLFADYRKANKDQPLLTTHMFRKRAFTLAWKAGINVQHASIAYGCNVDTLMKHYVQLDEQQVTDDVFSRMSPNNSGTNGSPLPPKPA